MLANGTGKTSLVKVTKLPHSHLHVHIHALRNCMITKGDLVEIMGFLLQAVCVDTVCVVELSQVGGLRERFQAG